MSQIRCVSFVLCVLGLLLCSLVNHVPNAQAESPQFIAVPVDAAQQTALLHQRQDAQNAAARALINSQITADLGVAPAAPCLTGRAANATPQTTPLPDITVTLAIGGPLNGSDVTVPASFSYTLTVQNIGDAATPKPFYLHFNHYGAQGKPNYEKIQIKSLAVNASRQFTGTLTYTKDGNAGIQAYVDTGCLFDEKDTTNNESTFWHYNLFAEGVDFTSDGLNVVPIATQIGDGQLTSNKTYLLRFSLYNSGNKSSSIAMDIRVASPLFGTVTVTLPAVQLPAPGAFIFYDVINPKTSTPYIFTAPTVKKVTKYAYSFVINPKHQPVETSYGNNASKGHVQVNPTGVNLVGYASLNGEDCYFLTGVPTYTISAYVRNGGTVQSGPSQALLYLDKTLVGTYNIPAINPGDFFEFASDVPAPVVKSTGSHSLTLVADSAHQVSEYNESDNKHSEHYTFFKTAP